MGTEIVFFLFGMLAIVPTFLLATQRRQSHTLHIHHYHHTAGPQRPQERPEERYAVVAGNSVGRTNSTRYAIVKPLNRDGDT